MSEFYKGNQRGWFHDRGHQAGFFHTYDYFQVGGETDRPRKVHIFLPRDYESVGDRYPVLYMNDGDTAFFPGGIVGKSWWTAETLSRLYGQNAIRPLIVVAICPINRDREYTHEPVPGREGGGLEAYTRYLADSVKPFIDQHYRTIPDPQQTTILGSSHGGLAAFYIACRRPDCFGNAGAMSPSFWVGLDTAIKMFRRLSDSRLLQLCAPTLKNPSIRPRVWLDWGLLRYEGFHNWFVEEKATKRGREMADLLIHQFGYQKNQNLYVYEDPDGDHTEESWQRRLPLVLQAFYR